MNIGKKFRNDAGKLLKGLIQIPLVHLSETQLSQRDSPESSQQAFIQLRGGTYLAGMGLISI